MRRPGGKHTKSRFFSRKRQHVFLFRSGQFALTIAFDNALHSHCQKKKNHKAGADRLVWLVTVGMCAIYFFCVFLYSAVDVFIRAYKTPLGFPCLFELARSWMDYVTTFRSLQMAFRYISPLRTQASASRYSVGVVYICRGNIQFWAVAPLK